ncbi:PREDICTED: solute carrier family 45 member 4-like isoform X2 [Amphimedon queenslandica]|uniref:Major facilitator superfamily (MFS) profile domain-containing protein n=1 Tax=Amphimedon queenslandica TaxID=400682 RepID=A0AAN0JL58_AMPQE|nr:PREDICTED: solute carrier family 45 member 4-like isoform X2 [Amphimedon queenslandica]|eukprot:XP_019857518.1 PREDICTED: solute carrier family 45 member 4-like isoform X2 [Amphimedon queenslandica]
MSPVPSRKTPVPIWRLILLSASTGAIDLGYAVEGAYVVPFMIASGLSLTLSTVLITLSPVMGMLCQGFIGTISDKCTCSWGRRRPFIVLFSMTAMLGFAALPYCIYLNIQSVMVIGISMCVFLLDVSCGLLMLPTRAYLLDVTPVSQSQTGNFILSVAIGVGATLGYALGTIDWSSISGTSVSIEHQSQIVFGISAVVIFLAMIFTIVSVKEQNPKSIENNEQSTHQLEFLDNHECQHGSESIHESAHVNQTQLISITKNHCQLESNDCQSQLESETNFQDCDENKCESLTNELSSELIGSLDDYQDESSFGQSSCAQVNEAGANESISCDTYSANDKECEDDLIRMSSIGTRQKQRTLPSCCKIFFDSVSIVRFAYYMSYNMWLLWLMVVFGLAADFAFVYGFTTFVGVAVYEGDPSSPEDSASYKLYTKGVRMGSLGLAIATVCCSIMSPIMDYIARWIRLKTIVLITLAAFVCALSLLTYCRELYQKADMLFRKEWTRRPPMIEGIAVATINTGAFFGQIIASLVIGPVVDATGDVNYFMTIPCFFITLSFFSLLPVMVSKKKISV